MLLGFKAQFEPYVLDGSKTHTIRSVRKIQPRVGETCHCYGDVRQKTMHLLGRWPCVRVESIEISQPASTDQPQILIDGYILSRNEADLFAWHDGFRFDGTVMSITDPKVSKELGSFPLMMQFWEDRLPFQGYIIHWDFLKPVARPLLREAAL